MQYANPALVWSEWAEENADRDDATKLAALREYIFALAVRYVGTERGVTADWLNKKLARLGITDRIDVENRYELHTTVTGRLETVVHARDRAEALSKLTALLDGTRSDRVYAITGHADPVFFSGPEDSDPSAVDPDAPTTVDGTLVALREIVMLAHISGPKICVGGANDILHMFGLPEIPALKSFTVTRPVEAVMSTTVEAYDEQTAMRVAGWRWENGRTGYTMAAGKDTDAPTVMLA